MLQARWEIEVEHSNGISTPPSAPTNISDDELKIANHEEVLATSNVRSDDMQKLIRNFLESNNRINLN